MWGRLLGALLGNTASNVAGAVFGRAGLLVVITPAVLWFIAHKDEPFMTVTYAHLAALLLVLWVVGWVLTRVRSPIQ